MNELNKKLYINVIALGTSVLVMIGIIFKANELLPTWLDISMKVFVGVIIAIFSYSTIKACAMVVNDKKR